ncbi:MAG: hypothetical protein WB804_01940, partial [Candidatus Dormiibacterota bacterium]
MHPSDGTLRRSLDEPVAVDPARREHIARCARCAGRVQRMSADASWVQAVLAPSDRAVDVASARARLAGTEIATPEGAQARGSTGRVRSRNTLARR